MEKHSVSFTNESIYVEPDNKHFQLRIVSLYNKEFLTPRRGEASGTAILFENTMFELIEKRSDGTSWTYLFRIFIESEIVRNLFNYTEDAHNRYVNEYNRLHSVEGKTERGIHRILFPLYGFLPLEIQKQIEVKYPFLTPLKMCKWNSGLLYVLFLVLSVASVLDIFTDIPFVNKNWVFFYVYNWFVSQHRYRYANVQEIEVEAPLIAWVWHFSQKMLKRFLFK